MAKTIFVEIIGNASQFKKELTGAVAATEKANSGFHKMGKAAGIAGLALAGGLALGLEKSVHAAMSAQVATERMNTAFEHSHVSIKAFTGGIEKAEAAGRKLGFTNAETKTSLGSLVVATHSGTKALDLLSVAQDVARFKGTDLEAGTKTLTMAMAGSQRALKQLGITLAPVTTHMDALKEKYKALGISIPPAAAAQAKFLDKQATAAAVIDLVRQKLGGQADAYSKTASGGMKVFNAQMDNLKEKIGAGLLPALGNVIGKLSAFADFLGKHTTIAKALAIGLGALSFALIALWVASLIAASGMSLFWIAATGGLILLVPLIAAAVIEIIKHWDAIKGAIMTGVNAIIDAFNTVKDSLISAWNAVVGAIETAWAAIKSAFTTTINAIKNFVTSNWPLILAPITGGMSILVSFIIDHWDKIKSVFSTALGVITGVVRNAASAITGAVKTMVDVIVGLFDILKGAWDTLRTAAGKTIHFLFEKGVLTVVHDLINGILTVWNALEAAAKHVITFKINVPHISLPHIPNPFGRAAGGHVDAMGSYLVGERGPEIFTPGASGFITPNHALAGGGGVTVVVNVAGSLTSQRDLVESVRNAVVQAGKRNGGNMFAGNA